MWFAPEVVMSASATPAPLTRWEMMFFASFSWSAVTEPPPAKEFAVSVMVVPPRRSRPSLGFQVLVSPMIPNSRTTMTPRTISSRPGRDVVVVATSDSTFVLLGAPHRLVDAGRRAAGR
jgi:hypothetical protein